jgi:hypothetical protein
MKTISEDDNNSKVDFDYTKINDDEMVEMLRLRGEDSKGTPGQIRTYEKYLDWGPGYGQRKYNYPYSRSNPNIKPVRDSVYGPVGCSPVAYVTLLGWYDQNKSSISNPYFEKSSDPSEYQFIPFGYDTNWLDWIFVKAHIKMKTDDYNGGTFTPNFGGFVNAMRSDGYDVDKYDWAYLNHEDTLIGWIRDYNIPVIYSFEFDGFGRDNAGHSVMAHGYKYRQKYTKVLWWYEWKTFEKIITSNFGWGSDYRNVYISIDPDSTPTDVIRVNNYSTEILKIK